jgi:hypothetical protein
MTMEALRPAAYPRVGGESLMNMRSTVMCAVLAVSGCTIDGERVELRASELPEEAAALEVFFVDGAAPRLARIHVPGARPLRIALPVAPGERVDRVELLDVRGQQLARARLRAGAAPPRVAALGADSSYFVDIVSPRER